MHLCLMPFLLLLLAALLLLVDSCVVGADLAEETRRADCSSARAKRIIVLLHSPLLQDIYIVTTFTPLQDIHIPYIHLKLYYLLFNICACQILLQPSLMVP